MPGTGLADRDKPTSGQPQPSVLTVDEAVRLALRLVEFGGRPRSQKEKRRVVPDPPGEREDQHFLARRNVGGKRAAA